MKSILILFLTVCSIGLRAQPAAPFVLERTVTGTFTDLQVDNLDNIYLLSASGQLKKFNKTGDSVGVFNDIRRYGRIHAIDVSNPLKVLLYFKDFGTVLTLDRFLSRRDVLDLRKLNLLQVKAIAQAYDNGFWVFDEQEAKLKHLNDAGQITDQFTDFRILFDPMPSPRILVDQNKILYAYDPNQGIYLFDYYGSFKKRLPYTGWKEFTVINGRILGRSDEALFQYDPVQIDLKTLPLQPAMKQALRIRITPEHLYVLYADRLEIFLIKS